MIISCYKEVLFYKASSRYMGEVRIAYKIVVGIPEGKRPLGKPMCRLGDNIKMYLREEGWETEDGMHRGTGGGGFVNTVINFRVP
jgi:hypothetical protein